MQKIKARLSKDKRRDQILKAAKELLLRKGFSFTTREIASVIGVTEAMIFHIFPGKKDIIAGLYENEFKLAETIKLPEGPSDDPARDLINYFISFYRHAEKNRHIEMHYLFALEKSDYRPKAAIFANFVPALIKPLENYFSRGIETGVFRQGDSRKMADIMHNIMFQFFYFQDIFMKNKLSGPDLELAARDYTGMILNGLMNR